MAERCQHLCPSKRESLLNLKRKEYIFDGTIGTCNTAPSNLELKDDANLVFLQPYLVPMVHKAMFRKEFKIILKMGWSKNQLTQNEEHLIYPIKRKKKNQIIFLGDFQNWNRQLNRKPYPMPKIREMPLKPEGF